MGRKRICLFFVLWTFLLQVIALGTVFNVLAVSRNKTLVTLIVDDDGPADFGTIQDAINNASPVDIIFVKNGTYYENVVVNKSVSLIGENRNATVIDAKGIGTVVNIAANNVVVRGFTMINSSKEFGFAGIAMYSAASAKNVTIEDNKMENNNIGVAIEYSTNIKVKQNIVLGNFGGIINNFSENCTITGNYVSNNSWGISLFASRSSRLEGNVMVNNLYNLGVNGLSFADFSNYVSSSNTVNGKAVYYLTDQHNLTINPSTYPDLGYLAVINSTEITIENLNVTNNWSGILLVNANNSRISNVYAVQNYGGIIVYLSSNITVEKSTAVGNAESGIYLGHSENSAVVRNTVANQTIRQQTSNGIELDESKNITVTQNNILNNRFGIAVVGSHDSLIYWNNFIRNAYSVIGAYTSFNIAWDKGYPSGGNYWSDYTGVDEKKGPIQDQPGSDGIGDTPYIIDSYNRDSYPLMVPTQAYISLPHHYQNKTYYCGPAALEMLFDFYGPDVSQFEIADVARTAPDGTYTSDMVRAAHFSNLSTSVGNEMPGSITGYTARELGYAAFEYEGMTMHELKSLIAAGYPVIVLTFWHYRVAVGYNPTHITFQDSWYGPLYNMTYEAFDTDWDYSNHWALLVSPWKIVISTPHNVTLGSVFNITATITYPSYPPFSFTQYPASMANATISLPAGLTTVSGETAKKTVGTGDLVAGASANVTWTVQADSLGIYTISVEAEGEVTGLVPPIPSYQQSYSYQDRIGGLGQSYVAVVPSLDKTPPITVDDYDGLWHTTDFTITLTATDDMSGVAETYYRINDGPIQNVSFHGHPFITTQGANIELEYWSVDNAGNEELPHRILTQIKLDKAAPTIGIPSRIPDGDVLPEQEVKVSVNVTDAVSGVKNATLFYTINDGTSWTSLPMNFNTSIGLYEVTIPPHSAGTWVKYKIVTYDNAENTATRDGTEPYCVYQVVPEFPNTIIPLLLLIFTLLAVILTRKNEIGGPAGT